MEENEYYKEKLKELADQVQEYRRQEEAALRNEAEHADLIEWSRDWRKTFEE